MTHQFKTAKSRSGQEQAGQRFSEKNKDTINEERLISEENMQEILNLWTLIVDRVKPLCNLSFTVKLRLSRKVSAKFLLHNTWSETKLICCALFLLLPSPLNKPVVINELKSCTLPLLLQHGPSWMV